MNITKHIPWIIPTVAVVVVGSGVLDRINVSFDAAGSGVLQTAPVLMQQDPGTAALAAVAAVTPAAPANVADQLAALLQDTPQVPQTADVDVTRNQGFSISAIETTAPQLVPVVTPSVAVPPVAAQQPAATPTGPVGADFFSAAQANMERDRRCIDDLRQLAAQARVYFPSGGLTGEPNGMGQARVLGVLAQQCPGVTIEVSGHSDPSGNPVVNQRLSLERAQAVVTRVAASGVNAAVFTPVGRGSSVPSNVTGPEGSGFYDRRVEFSIIESGVQQASLIAPTFGAPRSAIGLAACVQQLQAATANAFIEYDPRGVTISTEEEALAVQLGTLAASCPQARLRVVGMHSLDPFAGETPETGRLRAVVLLSKLVAIGIPSEQIILGAPSEPRDVQGRANSRIDFDVILEEL